MKLIRTNPLAYSTLTPDEWLSRAFAGFGALSRLFPAPAPAEWLGRAHLPADLFEDDHHYHVRVEIPGAKKEEVGVRMEDGELQISYQRAGDDNRSGISLTRSFRLPGPVSVDGISAKLENGILQVSLPRQEEAKPRVIAVN
ncbi:MAG: Hsp20/alpha crystallin family protein [Verrucomicrobiales bacterium]